MLNIFFKLWKAINKKRKKQSVLILILLILSALFEILTISFFIPFLTIVFQTSGIDVNYNFNNSFINNYFELISINPNIIFSIFIGCAFFSAILGSVLLWVTLRISMIISNDFANLTLRNLLSLRIDEFTQRNSSWMSNLLTKKTYTLCFEIINPIFILLTNSFIILTIIFFLLILLGLKIGSLILMVGIVYVSIWYFSRKIIKASSLEVSNKTDLLLSLLQETFLSFKFIVIEKLYSVYSNKFNKLNDKIKLSEIKIFFFSQSIRIWVESFFIIIIALSCFIALKYSNLINFLPIIGSLGIATLRILPMSQRIYQSYITIRGAEASFYDILDNLSINNHFKRTKGTQLKIFEKEIAIMDGSFKYPKTKKYVLKNLNFKIKKNEVIGIKGGTGSGKTTLISILTGLIDLTSGQIKIDNVNYNNIDTDFLHKQISYMPQDPFLIEGSIMDNIVFNRTNINKKKITKILKIVPFTDLANSSEELSQKIIIENGKNISGGQKQRINLIRTFVKDCKIVILDEPSNGLDKKTTEKVFFNLKKYMNKKTFLIISHDQNVLKYCDKIIDIG